MLKAAYCAVAWADGEVIATQGISEARAAERAPGWMAAALGHGSRASLIHRVEPVLGTDGSVRGALVADLRGGVRPGDARALMPVFAEHLALLAEKVEVQARRTASYEALVQIGMQIQAAEADVDAALHLIVERARELLGTDLAWMGLVNEAERRWRCGSRSARAPSRSCGCGSRSAMASAAWWSTTRTPVVGARLRARAPADAVAGQRRDPRRGDRLDAVLPDALRREGRRRAVRRLAPAAASSRRSRSR